ncbi:SO2930 family diheme c-type cytochrome [Pedobacter nyackensis]|uniref:SO2930 family diheme c-type cytochrome n=1 Tax=Pedobacter nyackensis TaxID=475255 RepID=UPI00292E574B|nr:SO2930 family diheme c-type cytochrome [Pedobacter nyackensis]
MRKTYFLGFILLFSSSLSLLSGQGCKNKGSQTVQDNGFVFKEKLSDYGFFKGKLIDLVPNEGVLHYDISTALFTDYAIKDRFIVLPKGAAMKYTTEGALDFPDSTIIVKNFAYTNENHQKVMIETRLLVKDPGDKDWKVMNYLWNKEQTDAIRHITGAKIPITLLDDDGNKLLTNYQVPNTNDCKRCHIKDGALIPIGPKARNLNITVAGQKENQLKVWAAKGVLKGLPDTGVVAQLPNWADPKHFSLNQRARAYLDVNCAHCHTKGGDAFNTGLFLEYEQTNPSHLGINKAPVSAGGGAGGLDYDIIPGDAIHSILFYRMNSTEPGTAMPELARTVTHKEGVELIRKWINNMPK